MADILPQEEIDALLSATEGDSSTHTALEEYLKSAGMPGRRIKRLSKKIVSLWAQELPEEQFEEQLKAIVQPILPDAIQARMVVEEIKAMSLGEEKRPLDQIMEKKGEPRERKVTAPAEQRIITSYDFKHPARVNKDQLRTLENLHDNFARLLSSTFSGAMRAVVDVDTAFVDQTTYAEFIMSLSNPSCSYQFTLGPTNGQAIIDFAMPVVFAFVDRIFGGKGASQGVDARQLTSIEIGVINRIVKRVIEDLEATWEPILRVEITDIELETNPEFMQITAASEIVILLAFEVNSMNASGLVSLCYPFFTLESILPRLGQQTYVRSGRVNREEMVANNRRRLMPVKVPVEVEMGRTQLSVEEINGLQVGDVIRMKNKKTDPCVVFAGNKPKYYAYPFADEGGNIQLEVAGKVPGQREVDYTG